MNLLAPLVAAHLALAAAPSAPIHLCLAVDRSATMTEDKATAARQAALAIARRLRPTDQLTAVAFGDRVEVVSRGPDAAALEARLRALRPRGGSALFAGIVTCADELQRTTRGRRPRRIVLLSDGHATLGPTDAHELGLLGAYLREQRLTVASVAVGADHHRALLSELGLRGGGGHLFLESLADLSGVADRTLGLPEQPATEQNGAVKPPPLRFGQTRRTPRPPAPEPRLPVLPDLDKLRARIGTDPMGGILPE